MRRAAAIALLAAVYVLGAMPELALFDRNGSISMPWLPVGIGLGAIVVYGTWLWPGIAVGTFVVIAARFHHPVIGLCLAPIAVMQAIGAKRLLRSMHPALDCVRDVLVLFGVGVLVTFVGATLAVGVLEVAGLMHGRFVDLWLALWWGPLSASMIVAPVVLTWGAPAFHNGVERRPHRLEAIALAISVLLLCAFVYAWWFPGVSSSRAPYFVIPLLAWAGLRFGPRGAAAACVVVGTFTVVDGALGRGRLPALGDLQTFVAIASIATMLLSAMALERLRAVQRKGAILEGALDAIITVSDSGAIREFNPAAERLFGFRQADVIGKDPTGLLISESLHDAYRRMLREHLSPEESLVGRRVHIKARRADGSEFPAEISIARALVEGHYLLTGFVRDVTFEHETERLRRDAHDLLEEKVKERTVELQDANVAIKRSEELLRDTQTLAHLGSFDSDFVRDHVEWSDEMYRIFGRDPATFTPTYGGVLASTHPEDREHLSSTVERARRDDRAYSVEFRIVRPDGSIRDIHTQATVFDHRRILGYCQDISERKLAEVARDRLVAIVESSDDAIIGLSVDGMIETWNRGAETIFGYSAGEVVGRPYTMLVPAACVARVDHVLTSMRAGQHLAHYELVHQRRDETQFDASVTTSVIMAGDRVIGVSKVLRDISERKRVETELRLSLREKEVLLREIHHRVKNNLQVISSLLNLQVSTEPSEVARKGLIESQSRIYSMALVHQLLYRSKDLAHIDLRDYLDGLVRRLATTYNVGTDRVELEINVASIRLDIDRAIPCGLIVNELVTNVFGHAFPDDRHGHLRVTATHDADRVVLEVRDDGIGIPPDVHLETIQTFGLQIARLLSDQLGGTIELIRDRGTVVRVGFTAEQDVRIS